VTSLLVGHGFSFDLVESWSEEERLTQVIIIGEMNGREFDYERWRWAPLKTD